MNHETTKALDEITSEDRTTITFLQGRRVTVERVSKDSDGHYLLTWGLEGDAHPSGNEGLVAVVNGQMQVEQVLNRRPGRKNPSLELHGAFDDSKQASVLRRHVNKLIEQVLKARQNRLVGYYGKKTS